jgi:hypothetical protein
MALTTEIVNIDSVIPHPMNVRQGDVGAIMESLQLHGQYRTIAVQKSTKYILAGNHTWKAAKALGWTEIAVNEIDVDDEQGARILLMDNRANDLATYNDNGLVEILQMLANTPQHLDGTGFDGDDLDDLLYKLNGPPEEKKKEEREGRSIVLPFPDEQYEEMLQLLKQLRDHYVTSSNSDAILKLLQSSF